MAEVEETLDRDHLIETEERILHLEADQEVTIIQECLQRTRQLYS